MIQITRNEAITIEIGPLTDSSNDFIDSPTLAAGDVKIGKDGGTLANLGTLPTALADGTIVIALTATETDADRLRIVFEDAAGDEWSRVTITILTSAALATQASVTALNNLSTADIDARLAAYDGPTNTQMVAAFTEIKGATWSTTDTLESIRDRGDAAWTTGAGGSSPTVEEIRVEIDSNSTQLAAIVDDTNELQGDWEDGGRLDLIFDAIKTKTDLTISAGTRYTWTQNATTATTDDVTITET